MANVKWIDVGWFSVTCFDDNIFLCYKILVINLGGIKKKKEQRVPYIIQLCLLTKTSDLLVDIFYHLEKKYFPNYFPWITDDLNHIYYISVWIIGVLQYFVNYHFFCFTNVQVQTQKSFVSTKFLKTYLVATLVKCHEGASLSWQRVQCCRYQIQCSVSTQVSKLW